MGAKSYKLENWKTLVFRDIQHLEEVFSEELRIVTLQNDREMCPGLIEVKKPETQMVEKIVYSLIGLL